MLSPHSLTEIFILAEELAKRPGRTILGITGAPGAGKSTLARKIVDFLGPQRAVLVPMDGYHLSNAVLEDLGKRSAKGAIDTFDAEGFVSLLERITAQKDTDRPIYAPCFHREFEESISAEIAVKPAIPLVVIEGNYLLVNRFPWDRIKGLTNEIWYLDIDPQVRVNRLVKRHVEFGKTLTQAQLWTHGSDQQNADLIESYKSRATRIICL